MNKGVHFIIAMVLGCSMSASAQNISVSGNRIEITKALDLPELTEEANRILEPYRAKVDSLISPVLGESAMVMDNFRPESPLGNWAADVMLEASASIHGMKHRRADFAVVNLNGLRSTMPKGKVTIGDVLEIDPFDNRLCVLTLTGARCMELFQQFAIFGGEGVSHGLRLEYASDGTLRSATLHGRTFAPERLYTVVTLDYLAEGNDNMLALQNPVKRLDDTRLLSDLYMDYIRKEAAAGRQLRTSLEGRVVILESDKKARPSLFIVHTNDTHSCIEPLSVNLADTVKVGKGGYIRRVALLKQLRAEHPNLLLFDSGDFSQGSPYYTLFRGDVEIELMNLMRYDAGTIGNHEFDSGMDNMVRLFNKADFPIVCCNYDFSGTKLEGIVKPYTIIEREGVKIGVTGLCPPLEGLVSRECYENVRYLNPVETCNAVVQTMRSAGCELVVCLSHLGWEGEEISDQQLISQSHGIDIVLGGHTHTLFAEPRTLLDADGKPVICNQMGRSAQYVGTLVIDFK